MRFVLHHSALLHLAEADQHVADAHELLAPSSSRSHVLSLLHQRVHAGDLDPAAARERLGYIRGLHLRLLGDAVMQRVAWEVADRLGWSTTYDAEYIALTKLQADALIVTDDRLVGAARTIVATESVDALLD
jgi:indolepyruvate ferredoxin oxidoreductase alpha subunit